MFFKNLQFFSSQRESKAPMPKDPVIQVISPNKATYRNSGNVPTSNTNGDRYSVKYVLM